MSVRLVRGLVVLSGVSAVAVGLSVPGCGGEPPCEETVSCPGVGGAAGEGGAGSGGTETGGASTGGRASGGRPSGGSGSGGQTPGSGGSGGEGGAGGGSCELSCAGAASFCDEDAGACVECKRDSDCSGDLCDTSVGQCVECLKEADCDAGAPVCAEGSCEGCGESADCAGYPEAPVCAVTSGECVECLSESDCGGNVCAPGTHTCTELPAGEKYACEPCEHDRECQEGQLCVEQVFDGTSVGHFCTWTKAAHVGSGGTCSQNGKPFALLATAATSIDGVTADLCVLRTTTCPAYFAHSQPTCSGPDDDASCGAPDLADGQCELKSTTNLCTYACLSDVDCNTGAVCTTAKYCSL